MSRVGTQWSATEGRGFALPPWRDMARHLLIGDGCWGWAGPHSPQGYAVYRGSDAHRLFWAHRNGPIPEGAFVCHKCDNRNCTRPDHLFLGSPKDNMADMIRKARGSIRDRRFKISDDDVVAIFKSTGAPFVVAQKYGVSHTAVVKIRRAERRRDVLRERGLIP